jgi:hypothetical protein
MELMPNPTSSMVTVRLTGLERAESVIAIYDQLGRLMMSQTVGEGQDVIQINLPENKFQNGNYVVRVVSGETTLTKNLMIIR